MNFVPIDNKASLYSEKDRPFVEASLSPLVHEACADLPFHLALLESSLLPKERILHLNQSLQPHLFGENAPSSNLASALMANGQLCTRLYYQLAAKRLGIGYLDHIPDDVLVVSNKAGALQDIDQITFALTCPNPRVGFAPTPNRTLVMAPEGEDLDRLAEALGRLEDLGQDLYLTRPACFQDALRRARMTEALDRHVYRLRDHFPRFCAHQKLSGLGVCFFCLTMLIVVIGAFSIPSIALMINFLSIILFLSMAYLRFAAYRHALKQHDPPARPVAAFCKSPQHAQDWPSYAVLVPLFREGHMVADLVASLMKLDYPRSRLKIYLVVEEVDRDTQEAIKALSLPSIFEQVLVPDHGPRTKPKALNYALSFVKSDLTVIFDAEDRPAAGQLKEAALVMLNSSARLACLQARLAIDNSDESWLSKQFSIEYAALFDGLLPFLSKENLPIPLGGTSNHFRTYILKQVGGWDPYNVTEDADLGLRLGRLGYEIGVIASDTQEEAPVAYSVWMKQRSRWFKGWMQTWLVHMRQPRNLYHSLGRSGFLAFQVIIGGMLISSLIHPIYLIGLFLSGLAIVTQSGTEQTSFWLLLFSNSFNLLVGYGSAIMLGSVTAKRRFGHGWHSILQMPLYWLLMTPAAWRALCHLLIKPHHWDKTPHGIPQRRERLSASKLDKQTSHRGDC